MLGENLNKFLIIIMQKVIGAIEVTKNGPNILINDANEWLFLINTSIWPFKILSQVLENYSKVNLNITDLHSIAYTIPAPCFKDLIIPPLLGLSDPNPLFYVTL